MATDKQEITEQMRRAADFVLQHQRALQHALVGQALTLDEHVATLTEIARQGGNNLMTAQAATETARRKQTEAASMRAAQTALGTVIGQSTPPEPDEQRR